MRRQLLSIGLIAALSLLSFTAAAHEDGDHGGSADETPAPPMIAVSDTYMRVQDVNADGWVGWVDLVNISEQDVQLIGVDGEEVAPIDIPIEETTRALIALPNVSDVTAGTAIPVTLSLVDAEDRPFDLRMAIPVVEDAPSSARVLVTNVWARPTPAWGVAGAYMMLINPTDADLIIVGVTSAASGAVELHETTMDGDMMRMNMVESLIIPAGESAMLQPGGNHLMLNELTADLLDGGALALTLTFDDGETQVIGVPIYDRLLESESGGAHNHS
jgi:copper(I)-binding protein